MEVIKNIFDNQPFQNPVFIILDILIVSFFIYKFYMMLRRTRGIQLLFVVGLIWVTGILASYFELELLDWLVTNIRPALVFAIIVLLQPELRRMTGELANFKIFKIFLLKPSYDLDEVVDAASSMASTKTGSIIVFVREISLKDIVERSVQLDAIISSSLLLTIFKKNSPLHDGAVIIEQNRIVSASSYLPMSKGLENTTWGARHRSALGLSEETDAVILVTSEETGKISICCDGEMIHPIKPFELKSQLLNFLSGKKKNSEKEKEKEKKSKESPDKHKGKER